MADAGRTEGATMPRERRVWLRLIVVGGFVWLLAAGITIVTEDVILVPTVILVGAFLVPAAVIAFALSRPRAGSLEPDALLLGFLAAGTLGVVLSAVAEVYLLPSVIGTFLGIGLIEEVTKGVVLIVVARRVRSRKPRDGMVLGAVVGAGFASFESAGYALSAMVGHWSATGGTSHGPTPRAGSASPPATRWWSSRRSTTSCWRSARRSAPSGS